MKTTIDICEEIVSIFLKIMSVDDLSLISTSQVDTFLSETVWISQCPNIRLENSILFYFCFKFLQDAYLHNVTAITADWIARHLFVALKTPQNETQIFVIDLELKKMSLKALNMKLGKSNSTVSFLLSYPFLR